MEPYVAQLIPKLYRHTLFSSRTQLSCQNSTKELEVQLPCPCSVAAYQSIPLRNSAVVLYACQLNTWKAS